MVIATTPDAPLRGIMVRDERDTIIVQATVDEVQRFARTQRGREVSVRQADVRMRFGSVVGEPTTYLNHMSTGGSERYESASGVGDGVGTIDPNDFLFDRTGRPVAHIETATVNVERLDVTTFGSLANQYVSGRRSLDVTIRVLPGVDLVANGRSTRRR